MISMLTKAIKLGIIGFCSLILGSAIYWDGQTLSDHVKKIVVRMERTKAFSKVQGLLSRFRSPGQSGAEYSEAKDSVRTTFSSIESSKNQQSAQTTRLKQKETEKKLLERLHQKGLDE